MVMDNAAALPTDMHVCCRLLCSIADQAGMLVQLLDAAQAKLKLSPDEQLLVQVRGGAQLTACVLGVGVGVWVWGLIR